MALVESLSRPFILLKDVYTGLAPPLWPQLTRCTVEDKWKPGRQRRGRSWPSDSVASFQGLMHPFLLFQTSCAPVFFCEIQGANERSP